MQPHRNIEGHSKETAHEIAADYVTLEFSKRSTCGYAYAGAGQENGERMKRSATAGQGFDKFISSTVSKLYERKEG